MKFQSWSHLPRAALAPGRPRTLGVLIEGLWDGYHRTLFDSIVRVAREHGVSIIAFVGGQLPFPLFDLAAKQNVDGLIVVASTVAQHAGPKGLAAYCRSQSPLPLCTIGVTVPGVPAVIATGSYGVQALVQHLIQDHGCRRLAFIEGLGEEGRERFEAFAAAVRASGAELHQDLVVPGRFTTFSGADAIRILFEERRAEFDAVVAADDDMALGAMNALEARGKVVPDDVAVVGFDDIYQARHAVVPLTTVRQPLREMGRRAVEVVLRQMAGHEPRPVDPIVCHPVKRRSCGCVVETPFTRRPSTLPEPDTEAVAALMERRQLVLADMLRAGQGELEDVGYHWEERLFDAIVDELRGASGAPFLLANEELARRIASTSGEVSMWQSVLSALRRHVLDCLGDLHKLRSVAENGFHDALLVSANVLGREESRRRTDLERLLRTTVKTSNELVASPDVAEFGPVLMRYLIALGLPSAYVSMIVDQPNEQARLLLGYDRALPVERMAEASTFEARRLVPARMLPTERSTAYVLMPISSGAELRGFVLVESEGARWTLFEALGAQISGILIND